MERKKWTKESVYNIALKYKFRNQFKVNDSKAYDAARQHKWLNDVCKHMDNGKLFWTKEKIIEISKKHKTRKSFMINDSAAYKAASKYGWLKDISFDTSFDTSFNIKTSVIGNRYNRLVYVYEFPDKTAYIGLTYNENRRHQQHLNRGPVFNYNTDNNIIPIKKVLSNGYIKIEDAVILEIKSIKTYKDKGWKVLNKRNGGELGGGLIKGLKEKYKKEALKFNYRGEFKKLSPNIYASARKKKWLDEICNHMSFKYKKKREE